MDEIFLNLVRSNINKYGLHITIVNSKTVPRYAYSIGLFQTVGFELAFAGGVYFMKDEVLAIINSIGENLIAKNNKHDNEIEVNEWGTFTLSEVHDSWSRLMMLGVFDFYKTDFKAYQIIPSKKLYTYDIPNMSKEYDPNVEPVWRWLKEDWSLPLPENSTVITNLEALQGQSVKEVMRWENDEWEMFTESGSEINKNECRVVPLGTMLGIDNTLQIAINLDIEKGVWRESGKKNWMPWE